MDVKNAGKAPYTINTQRIETTITTGPKTVLMSGTTNETRTIYPLDGNSSASLGYFFKPFQLGGVLGSDKFEVVAKASVGGRAEYKPAPQVGLFAEVDAGIIGTNLANTTPIGVTGGATVGVNINDLFAVHGRAEAASNGLHGIGGGLSIPFDTFGKVFNFITGKGSTPADSAQNVQTTQATQTAQKPTAASPIKAPQANKIEAGYILGSDKQYYPIFKGKAGAIDLTSLKLPGQYQYALMPTIMGSNGQERYFRPTADGGKESLFMGITPSGELGDVVPAFYRINADGSFADVVLKPGALQSGEQLLFRVVGIPFGTENGKPKLQLNDTTRFIGSDPAVFTQK